MSKGDKLATQTQNAQVPSFVLGEPPNIFDFPVVLHTGTCAMCSSDGKKVRKQPNNSDEDKASNLHWRTHFAEQIW